MEAYRKKDSVVNTVHGKVRGEIRNGIAVFRGIPYGDVCTGERRFLPPKPAREWDGIRDCTKNGNYAIQPGVDIVSTDEFGPYFSGGRKELFGTEEQKQDENCLVLNVLTPAPDQKKRPVVVYIHGGAFATGSGTLVLGAERWVKEEDLVLVGVNHRLNVFGYLYLGEFDDAYRESGMAGILDLVLALQWVQKNITAFGGDPEEVTIMGESGGGMKVSILMAMEKARGLFKRAIVESGSAPVGRISKHQGTFMANRLLDSLGLKESEWRKLLEIPARTLVDAAQGIDFAPVADNINLFYQEKEEFRTFECSNDIPLLIGASEDELAAFLPVEKIHLSDGQLREELLKFSEKGEVGTTGAITEANVDGLIRAFRALNEKESSPTELFLQILSQASFLGGGSYYQALAKARTEDAPVYLYLNRFDVPHPKHPELQYSWHTSDLPLQMRIVLYEECEEISRKMGSCWGAFIRTGNPSTAEVVWPDFTKEEQETMVMDRIWSVRKDPLAEIHKIRGEQDAKERMEE